jgi:hypothetical protein
MTTYWRGVTLDDRTALMMDEVVRLCGGDVNIRPTQGSYSGGVSASGGTHDGGGAIDLAGQDSGMTQYDRELIRNAGRSVGFAMWIRDPSQSDWPWHIHGEAVQDGGKYDQGCLSSGAHGQVVDYYEGRNGLASGAPDDGPRDYVGITWETYTSEAAPAPPATQEDTVASVVVNGQLNIFVIDSSGGIQQNIAGETAWTGWLLGIPGQWSKSLSATTDDNGGLSIVGVASDGRTVQQVWTSPEGWHGPVPFPGVESI